MATTSLMRDQKQMFTLREAHMLLQRMHAEEFLPGGARECDLVGGLRLGSVGEIVRRAIYGVNSAISIGSALRIMGRESVGAFLVLRDQDPFEGTRAGGLARNKDDLTKIVWGRGESSRTSQSWLRPSDLVGLVTVEDLDGADPQAQVATVMHAPAYLEADTPILEAAQCLDERGLSFAPVASGGLLAGFVWRADLGRVARRAD